MGTRKSAPGQETAIDMSTRTARSTRSQVQQQPLMEPSNTISYLPNDTPPATSEIDNGVSSTDKETKLEGMLLLSQAVDSAFNTLNNKSSSNNINNTNTQEPYESDDLLEMLFENYTPPNSNPPTPDPSLLGSTISSPLIDPSINEAEKDKNETNGANQSKKKRKMGGLLKCACNHCKSAHVGCDSGRPCRRCVKLGLQDTCVDAPSMKRGRPPKSKNNPHTIIHIPRERKENPDKVQSEGAVVKKRKKVGNVIKCHTLNSTPTSFQTLFHVATSQNTKPSVPIIRNKDGSSLLPIMWNTTYEPLPSSLTTMPPPPPPQEKPKKLTKKQLAAINKEPKNIMQKAFHKQKYKVPSKKKKLDKNQAHPLCPSAFGNIGDSIMHMPHIYTQQQFYPQAMDMNGTTFQSYGQCGMMDAFTPPPIEFSEFVNEDQGYNEQEKINETLILPFHASQLQRDMSGQEASTYNGNMTYPLDAGVLSVDASTYPLNPTTYLSLDTNSYPGVFQIDAGTYPLESSSLHYNFDAQMSLDIQDIHTQGQSHTYTQENFVEQLSLNNAYGILESQQQQHYGGIYDSDSFERELQETLNQLNYENGQEIVAFDS